MKGRKFWIVMLITVGLFGIAAMLLIKNVFNLELWIAWFGALITNKGSYEYANVKQKKVISENYKQELDK